MKLRDKLEIHKLPDSLPNGKTINHITQQPWFISLIADFALPIEIYSNSYFLPLHKSMGVWQAYMPPFMQKLECSELNIDQAKALIQNLKLNYPCGNICLPQNMDCGDLKITKFRRTNFILPLKRSYDELYQEYHKGHKLNIKSALKQDLIFSSSRDIKSFIELYRRYSHKDIPSKYKSSDKLYALIKACIDKGHGMMLQAQNREGSIIAACFLSDYEDRYIYHLSFASEEGREKYAMHAILDQFIKDHSNSNKILDFEGSMIPGVAYFMKGFGATEEQYYQYIWNDAMVCKITNSLRKFKSNIFK